MECYRSVARTFYRGSFAVVLTYSLVDRQSFEKLGDWLRDVREECRDDAIVFLVGNKKDILDEEPEAREVSTEEIEKFKSQHGIARVFEVSAKSGEGVEAVYQQLAVALYNEHKESILKAAEEDDDDLGQMAKLDRPAPKKKKKGCC